MIESFGINADAWLVILTVILVILTAIIVVRQEEKTLKNTMRLLNIFTVKVVHTMKQTWTMVLFLLGALLLLGYFALAPSTNNIPETETTISMPVPTSTPSLTPLRLAISEKNTSQNITQMPSIVIDGNLSDWAGFEPIMTDPEGDSSANVQGSDMKSLYAFKDNDSLYLMLELYNNPKGSREIVGYAFEIANNVDSLFIKWDYEIGASGQGINWLWNLTTYDTRINHKNQNPYGLISQVAGVEAVGNEVFEMKVPLSAIGQTENMIIRARTQPIAKEWIYDDMAVAKFVPKQYID